MKITPRISGWAGLAAALTLPAAFHATAAPPTVPMKEIRIYNNSLLGPIYPVISTPKQGKDEWLQGVFKVPKANLKTQLYGNTNVYRIYINPTTGGIAPDKFVTLLVPLYTQILPTNQGLVPDEFINWWKGGRTSLYDVAKAIKTDYDKDKKNPTTPIAGAALVICTKGCNEPPAIYHSAKDEGDLPANDPTQLTEYTMGGIDEGTDPITFKVDPVDYDISYVDQVYLPVAMEAVDNLFIGWIGTIQDVGQFKGALQTFLDSPKYPGWPTYVDNSKPPQPFLRIPSSGTIYASESGAHPSPDLTLPGESFNAMTKYWKSCTGPAPGGSAGCGKIQEVEALWLANYAAYKADWIAAECIGKLPDTPDVEKSLLPHVYGWAAYNEAPPPAKCMKEITNPIYNTPGYTKKTYQEVTERYKELQYETPGGIFNPYVKLVHFKPFLDMTNAYAFSIDDQVGNMDTTGAGLVIAVGGKAGLPNEFPYDRTKNVEVTVGAPLDRPRWVEHGFCTRYPARTPCLVTTRFAPNSLTFNLETLLYPVRVSLLDGAGVRYTFVITKGPPYPPSPGTNSVIKCLDQFAFCAGIKAYTDASNPKLPPVNAVVTPPPNEP